MVAQQPRAALVLAGVFPGQSPDVVGEAARLAAALGAELVCAYVNPGRYVVSEAADGSVATASVDPDYDDESDAEFPAGLAAGLDRQLAPLGLPWRPLLLAGDVADALAHCADTLAAALLVVGTHGDAHTTMHDLFKHSVATRLARRQHRPVLVVPTHHGAPDGGAPGTAR
ncbi:MULTISPECIES: universal stress protein [unclassified Arthrobacter]|uniref:universal stress protein n=1 Tax=unclassified Arthrobacter TaxID=235627 RepID=UPI00159DFE4D|nr:MULTISPECIES: universal stress protein [unclassified Arthrobacter]MCQ9164295.1 universal stress protein [Arthrobacter sp. STN4]NVM99474.1 universal stress protein [Arthrobacter sp. SDTb3-6]